MEWMKKGNVSLPDLNTIHINGMVSLSGVGSMSIIWRLGERLFLTVNVFAVVE